jgi:hypothetical protein
MAFRNPARALGSRPQSLCIPGGLPASSRPGPGQEEEAMKPAICNFCRRSFRNTQAVRAHLKACPAYRRLPKATLPRVGNKPRTVSAPDRDPGVHSPSEDVPRSNLPRPQAVRIVAGTGQRANPSGLARWMNSVSQGPGDRLVVVVGPHDPVRNQGRGPGGRRRRSGPRAAGVLLRRRDRDRPLVQAKPAKRLQLPPSTASEIDEADD